ncbi:MAG: 16S rRNA (cytosine1402-N4)-methyltransferase [Candidatus Saccharimonadales bacterium]|jgi:16S rRNA (cytosine1402-N4)-methyltransferase
MPKQKQKNHIPVLMQEVMDTLNPKMGDEYLDLTAGYGGHASEIINVTKASATLVDRDINAVKVLNETFGTDNISVMHQDFYSASEQLVSQGREFDIILADLGVSSPHLDIARRGFSIQQDGPLDMRMDESQELTAHEVVNTYSKDDLFRIIKDYGEDPKARRIASLIVDNRPFETTQQLAKVVSKAWPGYSRVHPATRTFQAIRIAVNDELGQLERSLGLWLKLLKPGGILTVISFQSLEDAVVKRYFKDKGSDTYDAEMSILTKRPLSASPDELVFNPRARSARLRAAAKIKTKRKGN